MKGTKTERANQLERYLDMAKSSKESDKNIQSLIEVAIKSGMSRESAEKLAKGLRKAIDVEDVIPRNVTDETILDLEQMLKNLRTKGRKLNATGGRVPFSKGKVVEGLAWLANKIAPGSTKIGQTSRPMAPKTELKRAIAGFQERENIAKELESFRGQIDDNIIREISAMEPAQQLKAIEDVKLYLRNMKNLKQETTLREFDIKGQKGHATGGRVSLSAGGVAGMLGE